MGLPINPPQPERDPESVIQPDLNFSDEQESLITELYSLAWSVKRNYPDWSRMCMILEEEQDIADRINAQNQRDQEEANLAPAPHQQI